MAERERGVERINRSPKVDAAESDEAEMSLIGRSLTIRNFA
jgi:hypothetical protein